ncbi:MAG: hypothetical protein ACM65M_11630 [Microcoleus sp.]
MKYFWRFFLALVISAIVVVTYGNIQAVGNEHSRIGRIENMTSQGANNSNQVKQSGLLLEIREPQIIALAIPENKPGATAPLSFTVSVTNPTQAPIPFINDALIPEIRRPDGQKLHLKEPINRQVGSGEYRATLVRAGEQTVIPLDGRLSWQNNLLQLTGLKQTLPSAYCGQIPIELDNSWYFESLGSGEYQLRFIYNSPTGNVLCLDPRTGQQKRIEVTETDKLTTPFVNFRLLQPVEDNKNAVEVDGIRFETFIPEPLLTVRNNKHNVINYVQIGMRITNNTPTPFYFSFYATFTPDIVMPDGRLERGCYNSDWMRLPEESDFLLATPGKSVTFFPSITLSLSKRDKFSLLVTNGYGGYCPFDLKPGIYQLRFRYENTSDIIQKTNLARESIESLPIEKVWTGRVDTPFTEFRIAQP